MSTLFCVQTRNGLLAKSLKQQESQLSKLTGETIKIIERSGVTVKQLLIRSKNWVQLCENVKCAHCRTVENKYQHPQIDDNKKKPPVSNDDKLRPVDCTLRGTGGHTYISWCVECSIARKTQQEKTKLKIEKKKQESNEEKESRGEVNEQEDNEEEEEIKEAVYLGESRRGPQLRSSNHWDDAKASKDQSHVFKHWKESHANEPMPRFGARVIKFYKSSMQRQIAESTLLWRWTKDKGHIRILNQKGMYNRCHLARLVLDESVQKEKIDDTGQELDRKGDMKQEDDGTNGKSPSIEYVTNSKASKTSFKGKKTNKQIDKSADISKYFKKTK